MKKLFYTLMILAAITGCETKVTTSINQSDSTGSVPKALDTIENKIGKSWDTVKVKVNNGVENLKVELDKKADTLKKEIDHTLGKRKDTFNK